MAGVIRLMRMIATMAFGKAGDWAKMMASSLRRVCLSPLVFFSLDPTLPSIGEDHRIELNMEKLWNSLHDRVNRGLDDKAKSVMFGILKEKFGCGEMLYIDADCLVLEKIDAIWQTAGDLCMAHETLGPYEKYLHQFGIDAVEKTFNAGVMLFRRDFSENWATWYERLWPFVADDPQHVDGQTVWNLAWHFATNPGILDQRFNQLHVKHGPFGAAIYHFSAIDGGHKTQVMESCYNQFLGPVSI